MEMFNTTDVPKSSRIPKLVEALYANMPVIESARAKLLTESYYGECEQKLPHAV